MQRCKRRQNTKARARRLSRRLEGRLVRQYQAVLCALGADDMKVHLAAAERYTRTVARLCRVEQLWGVSWDAARVLPPRA